jgi:stage III sporulation protein AH
MRKLLAKKQLVMVALVVALGVAVYLNYYFTNEPGLSVGADTPSTTSSEGALGDAYFVNGTVSDVPKGDNSSAETDEEDYFDKARASRVAAREETLRLIQETLGRADASAEEKKQAQEQAAAIAERVLQESNIENLILAKGFSDSVVFIDNAACSVVVRAEQLQPQESLQILEIVMAHAGVASDKVQITVNNT